MLKLIALDTKELFPKELENMNIEIFFDLAGSISKPAVSMSDIILVPI
ncbi:MAG: hypothetical protein ACI9T7_000525 [Oleiphilaceae bacterium]|jgi:hypothetical protein